jgi:hypothetical protein
MHVAGIPILRIARRFSLPQGFFLVVCLGVSLVACRPAKADGQEGETGQTGGVHFDVSAQPLQSALDAYSAATGLEVLYDSGLASERRSGGVKGTLTPAAALKALLEGTGLTALYAGSNAFAVIPAPASVPTPNMAQGAIGYEQYFGLIQASIAEAFCKDAETIPGHYRIALKFWIGPAGEILRPELLSSTHDLARDSAISSNLKHVTIGRMPPVGMPQPITMIIAPRPPEKTGDCVAPE